MLNHKKGEIFEFFDKERLKLYFYIRKVIYDIPEMDMEDIIEDVMLNLFNKSDISLFIENLAGYIYKSRQFKNPHIYTKNYISSYIHSKSWQYTVKI